MACPLPVAQGAPDRTLTELFSLLLRPRKTLGSAALGIGIAAALLGGAGVQPSEAKSWGIWFGVAFFVVNLLARA